MPGNKGHMALVLSRFILELILLLHLILSFYGLVSNSGTSPLSSPD